MNPEAQILHILFSVLFLIFLFERGYFQAKALRISGEMRKYRDNKSRMAAIILILVIGQIWVLGSFLYIFKSSILDWTKLPIPSWIRWFGVAITIIGMILEFSTQIFLGRNYSTTLHIAKDQTLVTDGPYRYVRHPMYTALITVGIGLGLLSTSWYFLMPFVVTGFVIAFRVGREEEAMIDKFGDEYIRYTQRTGRFLPCITKRE